MPTKNFSALTLILFILGAPVFAAPAPLESPDLLTGELARFELQAPAPKLGTVLLFISAQCPCSISHQARLKELRARFPQFVFKGIVSAEDKAEAKTHFTEAALGFPVLYDAESKIADRFGALKTPHVFVLDAAGEIVYRGAVDDSHDAARAKKMYLEAALGAMVAGNRPTPSETKPLGCRIEH